MKNQSMEQEMLLIDKMDFDDSLTCEDLRVHYKTGRNMVSGSGRSRTTKYRNGVQTNIGDIEVSVWRDLMRTFIVQHGENEIQEQLQHWAKENCAWLHTPAEIEEYALQLHASRSFENPNWCGYEEFMTRKE